MGAMSRVRAGVALIGVATVLAGCGAQAGNAPVASGDGASAGAAGSVTAGNPQDTRPSTDPGTPASGAPDDRAVGKPPRGAYDDTTGSRTRNPRTQGAVLAHLPGPARSTCVSVGTRSDVRSGQIAMGSFARARSDFAKARTPYNAAPSFFYVIPHSRTARAVTVVASRPGTHVAPVRFHSRQLESAAQWHYFPVHLQIPSRGTWRFQVTVDGDRGCFVASFT
jgi:hypothetical protein